MHELPMAFGKYYLTEKIAVGGMAEIYLAKLIGPGGFEKQLIIKQIHPELSNQPQFVDLFVAEAKTLVGLTHGNIVPIYELGVIDNQYFIAMEYIDGPPLSELQHASVDAHERIAPELAAYIIAELLKGLDYAHRKGEGVIHRDLSPRNVMISREGEVKLVDFGIAIADDKRDDAARRGRPEGSFPYMSPEQARSEPLTPHSDLFSVGVLLWETLTGKTLFVRADAETTLDAVLNATIEAPSAASPAANIPESLDTICLRALERDASKRYKNAGEFRHRLNRYLYSTDVHVGADTLSRLVALRCPPEVRREGVAEATPRAAVTPASAGDGVAGTKPFPRRGAGKRRAGTKSFATSVHFERDLLANATPLFPMQAITDAEAAVIASAKRGDSNQNAVESSGEIADEESTPDAPTDGSENRAVSPSHRASRGTSRANSERGYARGTEEPDETASADSEADGSIAQAAAAGPARIIVPLLLIAAVAGGAYYFMQRNTGELARIFDAMPTPSANDAAPAVTSDAAAARVDAARATVAIDAAPAAPPDARRRRPKPRKDAAVRAKATLEVGANPWGEVYLDGRKLGRAPGSWTITSGPHRVEVRFPVPGREQTKTFRVAPLAGKVARIGVVDFSGN